MAAASAFSQSIGLPSSGGIRLQSHPPRARGSTPSSRRPAPAQTPSTPSAPPAVPSELAPDIDAARQIVAAALGDGRHWLDAIEIKRLLEAYEIAMVPTFAAANAEQAVAHASALFAQAATVVLKIMSRDIVHKSPL